MEFVCDQCGRLSEKESKKINEARKHGWRIFCSRLCYVGSRQNGEHLSCGNCKKEIWISKGRKKRSKSGETFCNRSCATVFNNKNCKIGTQHPNYSTGIGGYRIKALNHYGAKCNVCGYSVVSVLEVHHIDSNRSNNELSNLEVLCPTHHKEKTLNENVV